MIDLSPTLTFLKALAKNNNREWFEKNKPKYLLVKQDFDTFVAAFLKELIIFDESLASLNPMKLAFRIYRDVRFSKDKTPYKKSMSAGFSSNGKMAQEPGYYLQIQPGNKSLIAGGIYLPDADNLTKIRQEIDYNGGSIEKMLNDKKFKLMFSGFDASDTLKNVPRGYVKDHPHAELLKLKSFVVIHHFTDAEVLDKKFIKNVASVCKAMKPLNDFVKEALA